MATMEARAQRHLRKALAISLLIHAGLLWTIANQHIAIAVREVVPVGLAPLQVTLASGNPQHRPLALMPVEPLAGPAPGESGLAPKPPAVAPRAAAMRTVPTLPDHEPEGAPVASHHSEVLVPAVDLPSLDFGSLQQSIHDSATTYFKSQKQDWSKDCQHQRLLYRQDDCPPDPELRSSFALSLDAAAADKYANDPVHLAMLSRQMKTAMARSRPFLNDDSVLGLLQRASYFEIENSYKLLNPIEEKLRTFVGDAPIWGLDPQPLPDR